MAFRFSEAITETGCYQFDFQDYQPLQLPGDPLIAEKLPEKQAVNVCNRLMEQASDRGEVARLFLHAHGLHLKTDLIDNWRQVEQWIPAVCEQSREPAHMELDTFRRPLRPMAQAFLFDLAFAYAQSIIEVLPELRLCCADHNLMEPTTRGLPAFPVIVQACLRPRDRFWDIPVPKIDSAFDNLFVPQPSWSPSTTQQLRKLVAAPYLAPI